MKQVSICLPILLGFSMSISSCSEEDEPPRYSIKVTNTTSQNSTLFISANGNGFVNKGVIPIGEFREYTMDLSVDYVLRASLEGEEAEDYFNEQSFSNANPDIISLNFDIF